MSPFSPLVWILDPLAILTRVIRVTGALAVIASVVLVFLLIARTHTAEIAGQVSDLPSGVTSSPGSAPDPHYFWAPARPGTRHVWIVQQEEPTELEVKRQLGAGIALCIGGHWVGSGWYSEFQIPDEAEMSAQVGDDIVIRAKSFHPPSERYGLWVNHIRYELRRGSETRSFSEPANGKFVLVCGFFVVAPLVLWGVAAGVVALCGLIMKKPKTAE